MPDWLLTPLLDWVEQRSSRWAVPKVALHLRLTLAGADEPKALRAELERRATEPQERWLLLDAVEFLARMHWDDLFIPSEMIGRAPVRGSEPFRVLERILDTGGSAYRLSTTRRRLERRVSEHTEEVVERAAEAAGDEASRHLRSAWENVFGLHS